jgi:NTE family protein
LAYKKTDILKNLYCLEPKKVVQSKRVINKIPPPSKMIEHLVLSGGANVGFAFSGALITLIKNNKLDIKKIKTIYGTSIGALSAFYISLDYELDQLETYLMDRPWKDLYKLDLTSIVNAIQHGGMYGKESMIKTIEPLLKGKELSLDITLAEYYEYCKIEIHMYATEYKELKIVDISHKTHPHWKLIDAIYASCCLPILFTPLCYDNSYYIDGAVLMNYPLAPCLDEGHDPETVLGIYHNTNKEIKELRMASPFLESSSGYKLIEYVMSLSLKMWTRVKHEKTEREKQVKNQISIVCPSDPYSIFKSFETKEERRRLYNIGADTAIKMYENEC